MAVAQGAWKRNDDLTVIDLGRRKRRQVKLLLGGDGPLVDEIREAIAQYRQLNGASEMHTLVVVITRKPKRSKLRELLSPFL